MAYSPRPQAILEASRKTDSRRRRLSHDEFWSEVETSRASRRRGRKRKARRRPFQASPATWRSATRPPPHVGTRGVNDAIAADRSLLFQRQTGHRGYNPSV